MDIDQQNTRRVAVFAAMQWECSPVVRHLRQVQRERIGNFTAWRGNAVAGEVLVVKTGVGPQKAADAAMTVRSCGRFDAFVSTGCAGGLILDAERGHVVVATKAVDHSSGREFSTHPSLTEQLHVIAHGCGLIVHRGSMLCVENALATSAAKRLAAGNGHVAVEMEGAAIAECAAATETPYVALRAILDGADVDLSGNGKLVDPVSGTLKPLALAKYVATQTGAISNLLAMQGMMHAAQSSLDCFFSAWFSAPPCEFENGK